MKNIIKLIFVSILVLNIAQISNAQKSEKRYFKNYQLRLEQEKSNDTLKDCSLYIFFYDTIKNEYIYTKPGIGTVNLEDLPNYEFRAFYKTPNSYQKIDSIRWIIVNDVGGFRNYVLNTSSFFSETQITHVKRTIYPYFLLYVDKITLDSGYVVNIPRMQNERFVVPNIYSNSGADYFKYKTLEEAERYKKRLN